MKFSVTTVVIIFFINITTGAEVSPPGNDSSTLRKITSKECKQFIGSHGFRSKEELLQLFHAAYFSGTVRDIVMEPKEIRKLARTLHTMFPLKKCTRITSRGNLLTLDFTEPQKVPVPGSFYMATLYMSKQVTFALHHDSSQKGLLYFTVKGGYVNLAFSGFIRLFNRSLENMSASELFYSVHAPSKTSVIGMIDKRSISKDNITVSVINDTIIADITLDNMKAPDEIVVSSDRIKLLDNAFELKGPDSVLVNGKNLITNRNTFNGLRKFIDTVIEDRKRGKAFADGIDIVKIASYELERRRMSVTSGFQPGKKRID